MKNPTNETQKDLETLFSKHQLMPVLREEFAPMAAECGDDADFVVEALVQIYLHRQADPVTMVGVLSPKYGTAQEVADKLMEMVEADYLDFDPTIGEEIKGRFMVKFDVSDDVQAMLDRYQYPLPMVVRPKKIWNNYQTGYLTEGGSIVLNGSDYFADKDMCLDHLNRANSVALTLDMETIESAQAKFTMPTRNIGEDFGEFAKRKRQAVQFFETTVEVMEGLTALADEFYLTHKYDRRGRVYASGYHVNTQGDDYRKAVIQFANKELIE